MTGRTLYETYLRERGWSPATAPRWVDLEPHRQRAWDDAAAVVGTWNLGPGAAVHVYVALLNAVRLAP